MSTATATDRWRQRISPTRPEVDVDGAEAAAADLLTALGLDLSDEALVETPRRMAQSAH